MKHLNPEPAPLAIRFLLPGLLVLFANAFMLVPTTDFVFGRVHIMLPLIFTFHWTLYRPEGAHWSVLIALGLFMDLWSEAIVGLSSLMLLGFQQVVISLRDDLADLRFEWRWLAFSIVSVLYLGTYWLLMKFVFGLTGSHIDLLGRWLVCNGFYPIAIGLFAVLDRNILYPRRRA